MNTKSLVSILLLVPFAVASAGGCASCPGVGAKSVEAAGTTPKPAPKDPGYYAVEAHDGRIYVFGDPKTHDTWQKSHDIQIRRTYIGAGRSGETIMFEARDKLPEMTKRLVERYSAETGIHLDI